MVDLAGTRRRWSASQLGGEVTLIDTDGLGGSAVLTDCVPSKTLIATAEVMTEVHESAELGLRFGAVIRLSPGLRSPRRS